jgi:hypothetical protein
MGDGSFTISAWASSTNTTKTNMVIVKRDNVGDQGAEPRLLITLNMKSTGGDTVFAIYDGTNIPTAGDSTGYTDGIMRNFVGVRDTASDKIRLYVDGALTAEVTDTTTSTVNTQRQPYTIGNVSPTAVADGHLDGYIDDVRFYNRALSSEEIMQIYTDQYQDLKPKSILIPFRAPTISGAVPLINGGLVNDGLVGGRLVA